MLIIISYSIKSIKKQKQNQKLIKWHQFVREAIDDFKSFSDRQKALEYISYISINLISQSTEDCLIRSNRIENYKLEILNKFGPHNPVITSKYQQEMRDSKINELLTTKFGESIKSYTKWIFNSKHL